MTTRFLFFLLLFLIPLYCNAFSLYEGEEVSLTLKGYYKNLYFTSKRQTTDTPFHADLNRIRTEWDAKFFRHFSAKVIWDNEVIGGGYVGTEEFAARQGQRSLPYLDMDYELVRRGQFFYGQAFYRAYGRLELPPIVFTIGRQRIDWGIMRLFTLTDLFTRPPIFDVEKEERVGNTAANLVLSLGGGLKINPVYAFHPDWDQSRIGGRMTKTVGHFDLSLLGGRFLRDEIFGFDFTGDVKKAGVRGEFLYDWTEGGTNFVQAAVGIDYGFENSFYFALEYFFNSQGTNNAATILPFPPSGVQIQTVHENFLGLNLKYDLTPLWSIAMETVIDLNGGSLFLYPESRYSFFSWFDFSAGVQIPVGKRGGEFTVVPNVYFLQTQLFF